MSNLFPELEMSVTEINIVAECLAHPSVVKYLKAQAFAAAAGIVQAEPAEGETPESYLRRAAKVRGMIDFVEALLKIEPAHKQEPGNPA